MRHTISTFLLAMIATVAFAQKPDKALIRVKYAFSHLNDTNRRGNFYKENMILVAGKSASVFLSHDKVLRDIETKKSLEEQVRQQGGNITSIKMPQRKRPTSESEYYYFANEGKVFLKEPMGVVYLIEYPAEKIDWKLTNEKQSIEGIDCKKATTNFKGRNWIAWYAEELPFTSGPWKLAGLPGLIVQAYDENKEISFEFAGLEKVEEINPKPIQKGLDEMSIPKWGSAAMLTTSEIKLPENVVRATPQEIKRLKEARANDPQGFAKTQMAALGMGGLTRVAPGPGSTPNPQAGLIMNNPIEKTPIK